jgi:Tfp pilus assembly protein PilF
MNKIEKLFKLLIFGLVALVPVFFLTASYNLSSMDNFNKIILFQFALTIIFGLLAFRPSQYLREKISFSFLDLILLLWLFFSLLSAYFGNDLYTSFWGSYSTLGAPLIAMICLVLWYFFVKDSKGIFRKKFLINIIIFVSGFFLSILSILFSLVGLGFLNPDNFIFDLFRLAVGTTEQLSIFLSFLVVLIAGSILDDKIISNRIWSKIIAYITLFFAMSLLIVFNFLPAWICLCLALLVLIIGYLKSEIKNKSFSLKKNYTLLIFILVISGFFLVFHLINPTYYPSEQRLAPRLQLDWNATKNIALKSLEQRPLLGFGTEMFAPINSLLREVKENSKPYWYVRFNQGSSYYFEQLIYGGLIGFCFFTIILLIIIYTIIQILLKGSKDYLLSALMVALVTALIVYSVNFVILFLFFTFLAIINRQYQIMSFKDFNLSPRAITIIFVLISSALFMSLVFNVKHLIATTDSTSAVNLNPHIYQYQLKLSEQYHKQALSALKQSNNINDQFIQDTINKAITSGREAINIAPYAVAPYENLAKIYRDLGQYSENTYSLALELFKQALLLEPSNPVLVTEIGIIYLNQGNTVEAINTLLKARELKPKHYQAEYNLAKAFIMANQNEQALEILNALAVERSNIDILYEQGRANFNLKKFDLAIQKFSQVISIEPLHANALYSLGLSYSALGEVDEAMYYLKKVADLNPDNFKLMEQISELETVD